ncbi:MAG: 7-cyano-7-deazaguanine synthase [Candidatus Wallbacteria bacterium]|nr:7-cyano-7-deazaguanine synthase [Candidatus Wallbacteria bacterium]
MSNIANEKVLHLFSGGLDSLAAFYLLKAEHPIELLFISYGQKALRMERKHANAVAEKYLCKLHQVTLPWYRSISNLSPLTGAQAGIPQDLDLEDKTALKKSAAAVWLPNRNGLFLNIAASIAEAAGIERVGAGFNSEEGETFPDNTIEFVEAANAFFKISTSSSVRMLTPVIKMKKDEIAGIIRDHDGYDLFYSCYAGGSKMCGRCESCLRAIRAFRKIGRQSEVSARFDADFIA